MSVAALPRTASLQAPFAAALLFPELPCPPGLQAWNGSDPARRLAVHRNNVLVSLIDALADAFPVTQALVGPAFFRAMAALFVRQQPPRSPVLAYYGEALPAFIAAFAPAATLPYLADVARLEHARIRAYHAADAAPVAANEVAAALAQGPAVAELRLRLRPGLALIDSPFAVASLWAAHQTDDDADLARVNPAEAEAALVLRDGLDVLVRVLPPATAAFIVALQRGERLAAAAQTGGQAAASAGEAFDLTGALSLLLQHGALIALQCPERN